MCTLGLLDFKRGPFLGWPEYSDVGLLRSLSETKVFEMVLFFSVFPHAFLPSNVSPWHTRDQSWFSQSYDEHCFASRLLFVQ